MVRQLNWQRKCLEEEMEDIFKAISGKGFAPSRIANFLESKAIASELTWKPPRVR